MTATNEQIVARLGDPRLPPRFWAKVEIIIGQGCWLWTASLTGGYGQIYRGGGGQTARAHRVAHELLIGPIPDGLDLDHKCRLRRCVNPEHLRPMTRAQNVMIGEGPCAKHARKTHCKRGHPFSEENTYRPKTGGRSCRTCHKEHDRRRVRIWCRRCRSHHRKDQGPPCA